MDFCRGAAVLSAMTFMGVLSVRAGVWCYRPYEYEAWMLKVMRTEADRGVLHFDYPGKYLELEEEPVAFYSEKPQLGFEAIPGRPGIPPHRLPRPETEICELTAVDGLYDLGRLDIGIVRADCAFRPTLFVGESLAEVRNSDAGGFEQSLLMVPDGRNRWRSDVPLAARYLRFRQPVDAVRFCSQVDKRPAVGSFSCGDARKERIWNLGRETLRLCTRTFLVDGIKRDRLPWAGDLAVEIMAEAYTFGDPEPVKRTLSVLGSGVPAESESINGVAAYSMWWVIGHDLLQLYFDEADYLKLHFTRICERMAEIASHEDERGFYASRLGWDFIDWTNNDCGNLKSEVTRQIIYFGALKAAVRLAERVGDSGHATKWAEKAERLRCRILQVGMDGTRHSRMMAIHFGLVGDETARRYAREMAAGNLAPTRTPYMAAFEVMALVKGGETSAALAKFDAVWGAMADSGASAYWEGYDGCEKGDERYVFYGRPFGKSLCHAWSSGPAFLIPGTFLGIHPTSDGWKTYEVKPSCASFAPHAHVTVPTPARVLEFEL